MANAWWKFLGQFLCSTYLAGSSFLSSASGTPSIIQQPQSQNGLSGTNGGTVVPVWPPRGVSTWFGGIGSATEANVLQNVSNMVASGMVKNGYRWYLFDGAPDTGVDSPFMTLTNGVAYPALTNSSPEDSCWMDFDTNYFPHGAKWLISVLHSNGINVILYAFNGHWGGCSKIIGTNVITSCQPGLFGPQYYAGWLSNALVDWKLDGLKDEVSGNYITNGIAEHEVIAGLAPVTRRPFYVNVATPRGYDPQYQGLFSSWRIGVGIIGDVTSVQNYYVWLDNTPFDISSPGGLNDEDEYMWGDSFDSLLVRNKLAMDSMVNSAILLEHIDPCPDYYGLSHGNFWADYENPNVIQIDSDFSHHAGLDSSNALLLVYSKQLADGTYAIAVQNRSPLSSQTTTINITNYYPALSSGIFTVHDCFLDAPTSINTNTYSVTVGTNNVAWFKLLPGVEQFFHSGTNLLTYFPWSGITFAGEAPRLQVNNRGVTNAYGAQFPTALRNNPAMGTNDTGMLWIQNGNDTVSWYIYGCASLFTATLASWQSSTTFLIYGDGILLASKTVAPDTEQPVSVNLTGVQTLSITTSNATETQPIIFSPTLVCLTNRFAGLNTNVLFTVKASGTPPLSYQWQFNGINITGATNSTLMLQNPLPGNAGAYTVVITDSSGSITSNPAWLTVFQTGTVNPAVLPDNQFQFSFPTTAGINYTVQYSTNLTQWLPLTTLGGTGLPLTLTDPTAAGQARRFYRAILSPP